MNVGIYSWHQAYKAAVLETDAHRKRMLIDEAVEALQERLHSPTPLDESERSAIMNARVELATLEADS